MFISERMMTRNMRMGIEDVYGYIGRHAESGRKRFTQKEIADAFNGSLGVVHYALRPLARIGAVRKMTRGFELMDWRKFLVHWASVRRMRFVYRTCSGVDVGTVEATMPPVLFTAYSGAKIYYGLNPSDYSECHVYGDAGEVKKRFPPGEGKEDVFCLEMPRFLDGLEKTPMTLLYVDLWNLGTWYAREFLDAVERKLHGILD